LYNVIGYIYGAENSLLGVNSFKLPDLRGRFALGLDNMNNYGNIAGFTQVKDSSNNNVNTGGQIGAAGRVGGATGMTLGGSAGSQNVVLDPTNVPNHSHTVSDAGHQHNEDQLFSQFNSANNGTAPVDRNGNSFQYYTGAANDGDGNSGNPIWFYTKTASATTGITVGSVTGTSGQAANVMNPYLSINYIIYAGA
jgi:microcystin-dependent protein